MKGGFTLPHVSNLDGVSNYLARFFPRASRKEFINIFRSTLKVAFGATADIVTVGAGGDVIVDGVFAVQSSVNFIKDLRQFLESIPADLKVFHYLFVREKNSILPFTSRLNLDNGLSHFKNELNQILSGFGTSPHAQALIKQLQSVLNHIIVTISDWVACLFPDTAGLAGVICQNVLEYIAENGFDVTYNLIGRLHPQMQVLITNSIELERFINKACMKLIEVINIMKPDQFIKIISLIEDKIIDLLPSPLHATSIITKPLISATSHLPTVPSVLATSKMKDTAIFEVKKMMILVIDKLVIPHIHNGVKLFNGVFPIYLITVGAIEFSKKGPIQQLPKSLQLPEEEYGLETLFSEETKEQAPLRPSTTPVLKKQTTKRPITPTSPKTREKKKQVVVAKSKKASVRAPSPRMRQQVQKEVTEKSRCIEQEINKCRKSLSKTRLDKKMIENKCRVLANKKC